MKVYDKDSSAVAVVLADFGESFMTYNSENGFVLNFERITRIKILKKEGLQWGTFIVPIFHRATDEEKLTGLKGVTYNLENGKQVETKLKNESVFREKYDDNTDLVKIAFSNVTEGAIVEISYKIISDFIFNFQDWDFQYNKIPVRWSEYRARIPEFFNYEKFMQGYIPLATVEQTSATNSFNLNIKERTEGLLVYPARNENINYQETNFRWATKDVPAFKEEPFMTTYRDYISRIDFELSFTKFPYSGVKNYMGSWEDINKRYAVEGKFVDEIKDNEHLKQKVSELTKGMELPEDKINAIHKYVIENIQWDELSRKYLNKSLRRVAEDKKGNSAELNFLLASMLEKAEIKVAPVLISTRDHGFVKEEVPISSQFNYVICLAQVGEKKILLDATQKWLPAGFLPERCLNGKGLVIAEAGYSWVNLVAPVKSKTSISAELKLDENGDFTGKMTIDRSGYPAENSREKFHSKGEAGYVTDFIANHSWEVSKSNFENPKLLNFPFKETHELKISENATVAGDLVYFNPLFMSSETENKFKSETREYPVDFGSPFDKVHYIKVTIPDGYVIEELPASKALALPGNSAKFFYNVTQSNGLITVTSNLQINRSLFVQTEYDVLREFFAQVVAKHAEQIVLKKK